MELNKFEQKLQDLGVETIGTPPPNLREEFPEGSMLVDVRYRRQPSETFEVIYLNPETNRLDVKYIPAIVDIWFTRSDYRYTMKNFCVEPYFKNKLRSQHEADEAYQIPQILLERSYRVYCKYSQIPKMIYEQAGAARLYSEDGSSLLRSTYAEYYEDYMASQNVKYSEFRSRMCQNPWSFKADFQPDVYFRIRWLHEFGEDCDVSKVTCGFIDIEIDVLDYQPDLGNPLDVRQPITLVTSIYPTDKIVYVEILEPRPPHKIDKAFHHLLPKQREEYDWIKNHQREFIDIVLGAPAPPNCPITYAEDRDNLVYLEGFEVVLEFFETSPTITFEQAEINLINAVYKHQNYHRPMFTFAWNAPFDFNYLPNRAQWLGYDPIDLIVPDEFESKEYTFHKDTTDNAFKMKNNTDHFTASTFTYYLCQERLYAGIRKSQKEEPSYKLDKIAYKIAKIHKLSNQNPGTFREFYYLAFIIFVLYNIRDVVAQVAIETKVKDAQTLYSRSYTFATSYPKCFKETHIVRDSKDDLYEEFGYVMSNKAVVDKTIDGAFQGAFVADPYKNKPTGLILSGRPMNSIIIGAADLDAAAMYPHHKITYNQDKMTLIYKSKMDNDLFRHGIHENKSYNQKYTWIDSKGRTHESDLTGPLFNSFKNKNYLSLSHNWFGLPLVSDLIQKIHKKIEIA